MQSPTAVRTVTDPTDPALAQVADLIVAAVGRREAIGLTGPLTPADYRSYLGTLLEEGTRTDAGLVVAEIDGAVAGTAQWRRSPYRTRAVLAELDRVCVDPGHRGAGLGHALVEAIAADAATHRVEVLSLEVRGNNHAAIALYEGCGFRRTGRIENAVADGDARHDVVLMTRELARPATARLLGALRS
ncbi:MAG: GNAT family N-acetyltransferase, partial [Hamadaea sp.]|nr:GNAT family N-acetyltransferase [Hamadaea sp.]